MKVTTAFSLTLAMLATGLATSCSSPNFPADHRPASRKTARQAEQYERLYGGPPVLTHTPTQPEYQPRNNPEPGFHTTR